MKNLTENEILIILAAIVIIAGIFMAIKGKSSMVRERFGSGVSPKNERKFMLTIGGAISIIGLDMLVLAVLSIKTMITYEMTLVILGLGLALFVGLILVGQKYFRR